MDYINLEVFSYLSDSVTGGMECHRDIGTSTLEVWTNKLENTTKIQVIGEETSTSSPAPSNEEVTDDDDLPENLCLSCLDLMCSHYFSDELTGLPLLYGTNKA